MPYTPILIRGSTSFMAGLVSARAFLLGRPSRYMSFFVQAFCARCVTRLLRKAGSRAIFPPPRSAAELEEQLPPFFLLSSRVHAVTARRSTSGIRLAPRPYPLPLHWKRLSAGLSPATPATCEREWPISLIYGSETETSANSRALRSCSPLSTPPRMKRSAP